MRSCSRLSVRATASVAQSCRERVPLNLARGCGRLFVQKRPVRFVTSLLHILDWNEMKGGGVNGIALSGGRFRVGEEMAKVGVTSPGAHLGALHIIRGVRF